MGEINYMSQDGMDKLKEEINHLKSVEERKSQKRLVKLLT